MQGMGFDTSNPTLYYRAIKRLAQIIFHIY